MMELCLATVTSPALRETLVTPPEDSVPAGSTSSAAGAQSVPQDTLASPTAGVSDWFSCFSLSWFSSKYHFSPNVSSLDAVSQRASAAAGCATR